MQNKKKLVTGITVFLFIALLVFIGIFIIQNNKNRYGDELTIANIKEYTKGKPSNKDSLDYIQHDLFKTVNLNLKDPVKNNSVSDILIRSDTFSQKIDNTTGVTTVTFVVDIESLKQSYGISYQWDADGGRQASGIDQGGTAVRCLPEKDLKYGDFSCRDLFTEQASESDPILVFLPHSELNYELEGRLGTEEVTGEPTVYLVAKLYLSNADYRTGEEQAVEKYKQEIFTYIRSKGLNPDDYPIKFEY